MSEAALDRPIPVSHLVLNCFRRAEQVLVLTHHNPDGDALGSAAGLAQTLARQGRKVDLHLAGTWPVHLDFLLEGLSVDEKLVDTSGYDLVVLLDCHSFDRLGPGGRTLAARLARAPLPAPVVVVDHHLLGEDESVGSTWVHHAGASSTGELVWGIVRALNWVAPIPALQAFLVALVSDTGFFSQSNTTAAALRAAADMVEMGGDLEAIDRRIRKNMPLRRLKLMGLTLNSLELHFQGRLATMAVTPALLREAGAVMADTEDFVELGRGLADVSLSALIKDSGQGPGSIRVGLRSRQGVDAQALAKLFGGGGHRQAAAYNDPEAADAGEALTNLLARAEAFL